MSCIVAVQFIGLTQESDDELKAYEVKGRHSNDFQPLSDFSFTLAREDGLMSKEYLVRYELYKLPQWFIIGKDQTLLWYGKETTTLETTIRNALAQDIDMKE